MKKYFSFAIILLIVVSCSGNKTESESTQKAVQLSETEETELLKNAQAMFGVLPYTAENENNPLTAEKTSLGKKLYFDTQLSLEGNNSCNSCHDLSTFGVDNKAVSEGDNGGFGDRNSPTVFNAALHFRQFWDGRMADVEEQAGGPILNPVEMAIPTEEFLIERLNQDPEYPELFRAAFPDDATPLTYYNIQLAIAAFERQLMTPGSFDDYIDGDLNALSYEQKKGLQTFMNVGCTTCHNSSLLGGNMYQKFALFGDYWTYTGSEHIDEGRFKETGVESDKYMFKVPSLRNVAMTYPYMHDGSVEKLEDAVKIMGKAQLNKELSSKEITEIVAFLEALTQDIDEKYKS